MQGYPFTHHLIRGREGKGKGSILAPAFLAEFAGEGEQGARECSDKARCFYRRRIQSIFENNVAGAIISIRDIVLLHC